MFEPKTEKTIAQKRSREILWIGSAAVLLLMALVVFFARSRPQNAPALENVMRVGSAEFDQYKDKITIEPADKIVHPNMIGMAQYEIKARLRNGGDRQLTGIELLGKMISLDDKVINQSVSLPIPRARTESLKPGDSMQVSVKIDAPAKVTEDMIKDLTIELTGLRFQ